ncbi:AGE family epimerase/isomerase [Solimonas terrae]|uniref:AGE family epimerase/isomerase n=1 Tax=Solimonas terrae TaxID=1396819 RepID=A0A6M2BMA6_9GAMM|nr:AGE family epimerase/isomerase [Solimonas terrae]NGY03257.1 AGE family epimerase/isomerase [Solimonas terrae]
MTRAELPPQPMTCLKGEIERIMSFYHPRCIDPAGGYFQFFNPDGSVHDAGTRHLVSSARMSFNHAVAFEHLQQAQHADAVRHGLTFLRRAHRRPRPGGYAWILRDGRIHDASNHCYGLAFVMLAYAKAMAVGIEDTRADLADTWNLLEAHFWEPRHGLYADEATADWVVSPYRGQNANMHLCEAFIAAWRASGESRFLDRAALLAHNMVLRQAEQCRGQIWEHYRRDWHIDWDYNRNDRSNIFRPWGLQPGHQIEWAKLLLQLDRHAPEAWRLERACRLFTTAVELAWDPLHGGLIYGYDPDGKPYDCDKYSWVQAEAMTTAALLHVRTGESAFGDWHERIAAYCRQNFVDPATGCWYRIRHPDNSEKPEPGAFSGLTDYHTLSAYSDLIQSGCEPAGTDIPIKTGAKP